MLPARHRLRASADFASAVRGPGGRCGGPLVVVHATRADSREQEPARVGFVVSKAVGGAVVRNRTKRRLRHLVADRLTLVPAGTDVVVRALPATAAATGAALGAELDRLLPLAVRRAADRGRR